jgi:tetratricopeptide (TPR) repeat protein
MKNQRQTISCTLLACLLIIFSLGAAWSFQNVCPTCKTHAELDQTNCAACGQVLNQCLTCGFKNVVKADFCASCSEPLAEMRLLGQIDPQVRSELRLGESDRARLERELKTLEHLTARKPQREQVYLFRRGKVYQELKFYSREAQTWEEYLQKFPDSPKTSAVKADLSEALRNWGYLFYARKDVGEAEAKFRAACEANPKNPEAWNWLGRLLMESGKREEARQAYENALAADPNNATAKHFSRTLRR